jgi:hypothetical protein
MSAEEWLKRDLLGHALLLTLRGVPTIYYGDEQGFAGEGGDQSSRQDMFASQVAEYNHQPLVGPAAADRFTTTHPLYREIATLARLRRATPALWGGATRLRAYSDKPGLFAVSRFDPKTGAEVLLAFNTSDQPLTAAVAVEPNASSFTTLAGACPATVTAPGTASISLPAFGYAICAASPAPPPRTSTHDPSRHRPAMVAWCLILPALPAQFSGQQRGWRGRSGRDHGAAGLCGLSGRGCDLDQPLLHQPDGRLRL